MVVTKAKSNLKGWVMTLVGALFFFNVMLQINLMTALHDELIKAFHTTASKVALLSAWGFYANVLTILPAGLLLDRFSVKKLMLINLAIAVFGTLIFAFSEALLVASIGRFLCGITMSFGLVACLKLASYWLPSEKMALASSLILSVGMVGGIFAQLILSLINGSYGWRVTVFFVALMGVLIALILWLVIKDANEAVIMKRASKMTIGESLKSVIKKKQNWLAGFFICFVNMPLSILGALFGVSYLVQVHELGHFKAAGIVSMIFLGFIFGSPFFGWMSDKIKRRKPPMILGSFSCLICILIILYVPHLQTGILYLLFFLLGFTSASQVIGFPLIAENNRPRVLATSNGLAVLIIAGVGYGLGLPLVGNILDFHLAKWAEQGISAPGPAFFRALSVIPFSIFLGIVMAISVKETRCKSQV